MSLSYRSAPLTLFYRFVLWPIETLLLFCLLGFLKLIPVSIASGLMARILALIGPFTSWHKRSVAHLTLAFPEKTPAERNRIAQKMWDNLGRNIGEYMHLGKMIEKGNIQFEGLAHLDIDKGGIIIGAHLGNWEALSLLGRVVNAPTGLIYRQLNNPYANAIFSRRAKITGADIYPKGKEAGLGMLRTLRKNGYMLMLADQQLREGISVPFFSHPAQTAISHIKLALKQDKPIYLAQTIRHSAANITVHISAPIAPTSYFTEQISDEDKIFRLARVINAEMERWITEHPEQWLWPHRRWGKQIANQTDLK